MIYTQIFDEEVKSTLKSFRQEAVAVWEDNMVDTAGEI
jgi:hypothetical protein